MSAQIIAVGVFDLVVFGGTGDLARRKLMPGLFYRDLDNQLPAESRIIGLARGDLSRGDYVAEIEAALREHLPAERIDPATLERFLGRLHHVALDATGERGWPELAALLGNAGDRVRVFYLATAPSLFGPICHKLGAAGLNVPSARVVLEKPIGRDLASARRINDEVGAVFAEQAIFRIDHYLGKETVQNLMVLRFANSLFEPLWNSGAIDHVQITVAETIGVEARGAYYEQAGALRDMVQNHILQLLCLVAMEPPTCLEAGTVRDEKLKVLRALRPIRGADVAIKTVRGQYRAGATNGGAVPGYLEEAGSANSVTETFVVLKAEVENWRWAGVPFYLRTGKRLPSRASEIVIQFRRIPHSIFDADAGSIVANRLVVRLQPDEGVQLLLMSKDPGPGGMRLRATPLNLSFAETFRVRYPDAYERLLMDVVRGNPTLFMRRDEVEAAWAWIEPILEAWQSQSDPPKPYAAGTWGPSAAIALIERDGRTWHEEAA
ncbi:MAG TPA: glucose-6-phosphate dehydrogenase [Geminicoccaceae bacterium]|nr:glucose-6-phosphate dehydrogenase [Geminicoccaceae bacterium]